MKNPPSHYANNLKSPLSISKSKAPNNISVTIPTDKINVPHLENFAMEEKNEKKKGKRRKTHAGDKGQSQKAGKDVTNLKKIVRKRSGKVRNADPVSWVTTVLQ